MNSVAEMAGLSEDVVRKLARVFSCFDGISSVYLYGSRAKGNYRPGSDIDMTIIGELDYQGLQQLELALDDLLLPYKLDVSLYRDIENPRLLEHIDRVGVELWKRQG